VDPRIVVVVVVVVVVVAGGRWGEAGEGEGACNMGE
jgi:hypothetical protein